MLIHKGIDAVTVSKRLGQSSPAITLAIYSRMFAKDAAEGAAAIEAALGQ